MEKQLQNSKYKAETIIELLSKGYNPRIVAAELKLPQEFVQKCLENLNKRIEESKAKPKEDIKIFQNPEEMVADLKVKKMKKNFKKLNTKNIGGMLVANVLPNEQQAKQVSIKIEALRSRIASLQGKTDAEKKNIECYNT